MHLQTGEPVQNVRRLDRLDPVELDVLAGGEMAEAAVEITGDPGQPPQLGAGQRAIRNGHPQHIGVKLQIEPVLQPQRLELFLVQLAAKPPFDLITELRRENPDKVVVDGVVAIHGRRRVRPQGRATGIPVVRKVGRRANAWPAGGTDTLARRGTRRPLIHRHLIGGEDFVAPLRAIDDKAGAVGKPAGKAVRKSGIFDPCKVGGQPDDRPRPDPVGGEFDAGHAGRPSCLRPATSLRAPSGMITTSSPRDRIAAALILAKAGGTATSSTSRRAS